MNVIGAKIPLRLKEPLKSSELRKGEADPGR